MEQFIKIVIEAAARKRGAEVKATIRKEGEEKRADHTETKTALLTENEKPGCIGFGRI